MKHLKLLTAVVAIAAVATIILLLSFNNTAADSDLKELEQLTNSIEKSIDEYEGIINGSFNKRINEHLENGAWEKAQDMIEQKYFRLLDLETTRQELLRDAIAGYSELARHKEEGLY